MGRIIGVVPAGNYRCIGNVNEFQALFVSHADVQLDGADILLVFPVVASSGFIVFRCRSAGARRNLRRSVRVPGAIADAAAGYDMETDISPDYSCYCLRYYR